MRIYVDNVSVILVNSSKLDTNVNMSVGTHYVVVQAWDSAGAVQKNGFNLTVATSASPVPAGSKVFSNIDQMTGWQWCDKCAGPGGNGSTAIYSMQQGISTPAMDGSSAQFNLGGDTPYSAALWWKQLGGDKTVRNFVYDLYFYIKNPAASQALEFDVNQAQNGLRHIFGTQCDYKDHKTWDVFDGYNRKWISTGIPCAPPAAYTWNHVVLEFQRTADNKTKFVSVTLNGTKSYINRVYEPHTSSTYELNVAYQMDGDKYMTDYSTWVDKITLSAW